MTAGDILRGAATHIRQRGWAQGRAGASLHLTTPFGNCARNAIADVTHDNRCYGEARAIAFDALLTAIGSPRRFSRESIWALDDIYDWNDGAGQTPENVIAALELAAVIADQQAAARATPDLVAVTV